MSLTYNGKVNKKTSFQFNEEELQTRLRIVISLIYYFPTSTILTLSSVTGFHTHIIEIKNGHKCSLKKQQNCLAGNIFH